MKPNKKTKEKNHVTILPVLEKAKHTLPPGLELTTDPDKRILTLIDREHYGGIHTVEDGFQYTLRLGVHRKLKKAAMPENALIYCVIPISVSTEQRISAAFFLPEAATEFVDTVVLKSDCRFRLKYIMGSAVLENHYSPCGLLLSREAAQVNPDHILIFQNGLRREIPSPRYQCYFDVLRFEVEVCFIK